MCDTQYTILSADTSTQVCSVALHVNGELLVTLETYTANTHAENLNLMLNEVCRLSGTSLENISAFALAKGPGSYTGLRISCAALKGLCFALDKPLIAISTLKLMAEGLRPFVTSSDDYICPMIDARRMEVYQGLFDGSGQETEPERPLVLEESSYLEILNERKIIFAGNGAEKFQSLTKHPNAVFLKNYHPLAKNMGSIAFENFRNQNFADLTYFEPEYLKEFYTTAKVN